jgi:flagellar basal body-associated protein FliL
LAEQVETRKISVTKQTVAMWVIVAVLVVLAAVTMVTVARTFTLRPSNFVTLPTTPVSKTGQVVVFDSLSPIVENNLAVGVQGYLETSSGQPVAGANVYVQYYLEGAYRTQVGTTDANGFFQIRFPMNWTGWLPLTMFYFGDSQHQGLQQIVSLPGESL